MCGIFGAIGEYDINDVRILAVLNESRGTDSFGIFNGYSLYKSTVRPRDNLNITKLSEKTTPFIMGHTRNASVGAVKQENAHPFKVGSVIGAHNGSIYNFEWLKNQNKDEIQENFEVDSQIIFWGIWKKGFEIFKMISGTWALSWYDLRTPEYFWLGSHTSPLAVGETESALYYSSERKDLERIGVKAYEVSQDTVMQVHVPTLTVKEMKVEVYRYSGYGSDDCYSQYGRSKHSETSHVGVSTPLWNRYGNRDLPKTIDRSTSSSSVIIRPGPERTTPVEKDKSLTQWNPLGFQNRPKMLT